MLTHYDVVTCYLLNDDFNIKRTYGEIHGSATVGMVESIYDGVAVLRTGERYYLQVGMTVTFSYCEIPDKERIAVESDENCIRLIRRSDLDSEYFAVYELVPLKSCSGTVLTAKCRRYRNSSDPQYLDPWIVYAISIKIL